MKSVNENPKFQNIKQEPEDGETTAAQLPPATAGTPLYDEQTTTPITPSKNITVIPLNGLNPSDDAMKSSETNNGDLAAVTAPPEEKPENGEKPTEAVGAPHDEAEKTDETSEGNSEATKTDQEGEVSQGKYLDWLN